MQVAAPHPGPHGPAGRRTCQCIDGPRDLQRWQAMGSRRAGKWDKSLSPFFFNTAHWPLGLHGLLEVSPSWGSPSQSPWGKSVGTFQCPGLCPLAGRCRGDVLSLRANRGLSAALAPKAPSVLRWRRPSSAHVVDRSCGRKASVGGAHPHVAFSSHFQFQGLVCASCGQLPIAQGPLPFVPRGQCPGGLGVSGYPYKLDRMEPSS